MPLGQGKKNPSIISLRVENEAGLVMLVTDDFLQSYLLMARPYLQSKVPRLHSSKYPCAPRNKEALDASAVISSYDIVITFCPANQDTLLL